MKRPEHEQKLVFEHRPPAAENEVFNPIAKGYKLVQANSKGRLFVKPVGDWFLHFSIDIGDPFRWSMYEVDRIVFADVENLDKVLSSHPPIVTGTGRMHKDVAERLEVSSIQYHRFKRLLALAGRVADRT